jgi:ribonucleoside-diphosphate reductase alpha chain
MMGVLSCWHPSIEEFITAKQQSGVLTKFNLSVLITDEFISAVKKHKPWKLIFPDTTHPNYDEEWNGNIDSWREKKYSTITYKEYSDANELWDLILESTYNRAEPGVLFYNRINELNNLNYLEDIRATNPCGEQPLQPGGSCVLSSINLSQYINESKTDFDYTKLAEDIPLMVRFLDAINDLTSYPLPEQKKEALSKRRIGIGYMGYASSLYILKQRYGSPKALKLTEKLAKFTTNTIYQASANLAHEKGVFPLYNKKAFLNSNFIKQALTDETTKVIAKHGIRNSHLTTIAPTGNSSIFANNVSGGIEPVISHDYIRTVITQNPPQDLEVPQKINWDTHSCQHKDGWSWKIEGDDYLLKKTHNGVTYKIDQNRGLTREEEVTDYAVLNLKNNFDAKAEYAVTLFELNVDEHINTMKVFSKYIDSAISKTVNVPNDYAYEEFKEVYLKAYNAKTIKGLTTYRMGTMASVVSSKDESKQEVESSIHVSSAPERPTSLPCDLVRITIKGEQWIIFIGLLKGNPYEVFAGKIGDINLPKSIKHGSILKQKSKVYSFEYDGEILIKHIGKTFESDENECVSRLISTSLRHGTPIDFIVNQLAKSKGSVVDFSKSIMRALKKYIKETDETGTCPTCGGKLIYIEGCAKCSNCSWSKCS